MSNIESLTEDLNQLSVNYEPDDEVRAGLAPKELVMLIGPFVVGKTSIMEQAEWLDPEFQRVVSFTTRDRRPNESPDTYNFLPHDKESLSAIKAKAVAGALVQLTVHPTTGNIYGTELAAYGRQYPMLDLMPVAVESMEPLAFKHKHKIGITTPDHAWHFHFAQRKKDMSSADIKARLREGVHNIEWSLDQPDMSWIVNDGRPVADSARHMIGVVKGTAGPSRKGRQIAASLRQTLKAMLEA